MGQLPASFIESAPVSLPTAVDQIRGVVVWIEYRCEHMVFKGDPHGIIRFGVCNIEDEWIEVGQIEDLTLDLLAFELRHSRSVAILDDPELGLALFGSLSIPLSRLRFALLNLLFRVGHDLLD